MRRIQWSGIHWGEESLSRAKAEDKPILLSIGYSACHWCHVMAHECFENLEIAGLMNQDFINVKVDREERPDLDDIYQKSAQVFLGRGGGWPLTMFLTPDQEPFYGGTYFPPAPCYNLPGFPEVLRSVVEAYRNHRDDVRENVEKVKAGLLRVGTPQPSADPLTDHLLDRLGRKTSPIKSRCSYSSKPWQLEGSTIISAAGSTATRWMASG